MPKRPLAYLLVLFSWALAGATASAQSRNRLPDSTTAARHPLMTKRQAKVGAFAVLATFALMPFDHRLLAQMESPRLQKEDDFQTAARRLSFMGGPGPFLVGAGLIAIGRAGEVDGVAAAGSRVTESVLLAAAINAVGKGIAGRALPGVKTLHSFSFGRGFHDHNGPFVAFPSGHTAAAFALATALTAEADRSAHGWSRLIRPLSYTAATGVAIARVYQHKHWVSDLPVAAAIGTWSGSTVESRRNTSSPSKDASVSLGDVSIVPYRRGFMVASSVSFAARR
jgi:membrane-associated phospholipid phosphatase